MLAYVEPFSGIAGDMAVGALLDLGLSMEDLERALSGLALSGYRMSAEKVSRGSLAGTGFHVELAEEEQPHRTLGDVRELILSGGLSEGVVARSLAAFDRLADAEGEAHGIPREVVHFHEVGAVDSIVDVVAAAVGLEHFGIDRLICSRVRVGTGEVVCRHGRIPVPAPATLNLLRGFPIVMDEDAGETVTPTGAALLAAWSEPDRDGVRFRPDRTGYGAGQRTDTPLPNLLRVTIGESARDGAESDEVVELSANVDDQSPEEVAYATEGLLAAGALDCWVTPIVMKKGRPAHLISALATPSDAEQVEEAFFALTSTFGVRRSSRRRTILTRSFEAVETPYGPVRVKVGRRGGHVVRRSPEYEDCARIAAERGVPLRDVYTAATSGCSRPS